MRAIFLDFDGVLISYPRLGVFDEKCVERVNRIVEATDARIVVSSTWRLYHGDLFSLNRQLTQNGLPEAFGMTPQIRGCPRGTEILGWIGSFFETKGKLDSYVVLDDGEDRGAVPPWRWIEIENGLIDGGIQDHHVKSAISVLNVIGDLYDPIDPRGRL